LELQVLSLDQIAQSLINIVWDYVKGKVGSDKLNTASEKNPAIGAELGLRKGQKASMQKNYDNSQVKAKK
jgi:hypothetical protein